MIKNITGESFKGEIEDYKGTVIIDFFADWCAPCKSIAPIIEDVAENAAPDVKVCKINIDSETELTERFGIMSIPTIVVMKNGNIVNRSIGVTGKKAILDMIE